MCNTCDEVEWALSCSMAPWEVEAKFGGPSQTASERLESHGRYSIAERLKGPQIAAEAQQEPSVLELDGPSWAELDEISRQEELGELEW